MMAHPVPHHTTDKKRVKVYELRNNDWFDRGTGFCTAQFVPVQENQPKEPRVIVESEDHPDRLLLETKIVKDDGFQKQQDTLIVWTENNVDMALSFQEAEGCAMIWKFIDGVQQTFHNVLGGADDSLSEDLTMDMSNSTFTLPPADLANLPDLENIMRQMSNTANGREMLVKSIMEHDIIPSLGNLVEMAEDLESLDDLFRLCNMTKTMLLLNDTAIIEKAVSDECVLGVVGALEYDPDFPKHKANHRQWLSNQTRFKEVVKIEDDTIRRKIQQTFRLLYLKDVVLARILDDPTFSVLNSLIFFNQVDIINHIQTNGGFLNDLFAIFADSSAQHLRKKQAVTFLHDCCAIAKNLQPPARQNLYTNFLGHGLVRVINFGLCDHDVTVRVHATDILVAMIDHDPQMVRHTIYRQLQERQKPLTDVIIDLLLVEVDLGVKSQMQDALRILLDVAPIMPPDAREYPPNQQRLRQLQSIDPQQELLIQHFYENSAARLFKPLLDLEGQTELKFQPMQEYIFGYLNDILCSFIRQHQHRAKYFLITHSLAQRFVQLLSCKQKHLQLVAIRFIKQLVLMNDEFYMKHIAEKQILGPILDVLLRAITRDNLLCSACLDLFVLINKENVKDLIKHLVENYREKIMALSHMDTFREMVSRYDQTEGYTTNPEYFMDEDEDEGPTAAESERRPTRPTSGLMEEQLTVDQAQEEYWNGVSDEEDEGPQNDSHRTNGTATTLPLLKPLVEYGSDEEDGVASDEATAQAKKNDEDNSSNENGEPPVTPTKGGPAATAAAAVVATPPERISEKRRREEDEDDDAFDKLLQSKRRGSNASAASAGADIRKKMGISEDDGPAAEGAATEDNGTSTADRTSPNPASPLAATTAVTTSLSTPKKIAFNISSKVKSMFGGGGKPSEPEADPGTTTTSANDKAQETSITTGATTALGKENVRIGESEEKEEKETSKSVVQEGEEEEEEEDPNAMKD
ncbi:component of IIS longevity pathway SMK-1-domain-containing protein [Neurospora hispaniola]|uniref:Component of IIS longevity pathway SMK-1-domain-containing protein n=1 Tax=Neurospora hispaniola TaxID=588809 RepID=A0AAJ0I1X3_9PEZI|nr:component of IIS longevity pathway SMK-1-domain-containing protein [Neurospora hispaniola]